jgi:TonB family protein
MARRKTLIGISIAGHAALFAGVFVSSVWDVDRLDYDVRFRPNLAVITPPRLDGPAPATDTRPQTLKERPKAVVKETRQPRKVKDDVKITVEVDHPPGDGTSKGTGPGTDDGIDGADPCQTAGGCAPLPDPPLPPEPPKVPPPPPPQVHTVAPQVLSGLRIHGVTAIHPPRDVFQLMHRNGDLSTTATIKLCVTTTGTVSAASMLKSSKYAAYDDAILDTARRWLYRPYTVNGTPVPACSVVTFRYEMK